MAAATQLLASGWDPVRPEIPVAKERAWLPCQEQCGTIPARFSARHPDLWFAFPDVAQRPAPRRRRVSTRYWMGRVESGLMGRSMLTTGDLEFQGVKSCELDPAVGAMIEQPIVVRYLHAGRWRRYTPDLYLECAGANGFIEFKHEEHACKPEEEDLFVAKGTALAAAGYFYRVLTERHMSAATLVGNVKLVTQLRHERTDALQVAATRVFLAARGTVAVADLQREAGVSFGQVVFMLRHCILGADLWSVPLDGATLVSLRTPFYARRPDGRVLSAGLRPC